MTIAVTSAYPLDSAKGNVVSVKRIARLIGGVACHGIVDPVPDVLVALHARKSAPACRHFRDHNPEGKLIVVLSGTDLYQDIPIGDKTSLKTLADADILAVYQKESLKDIPSEFRPKARVCGKSVDITIPKPRPKVKAGLITVINHLRAVKDPFLPIETLQLIDDSSLKLFQLGEAIEPNFAEVAHKWEEKDKRYQWLGGVTRAQTLENLCRSSLTVCSSLMEGGSNALAEAVMCETPILATDISGNRGMLGEDYLGYFPIKNPQALADLTQTFFYDTDFAKTLKQQIIARQPLLTPQNEKEKWSSILAE